jgi:hypothetical protein
VLELAELSVAEEDKLTETEALINRTGIILLVSQTGVTGVPHRHKATEALLPFSTWDLCEPSFSAVDTMKRKNRSRLRTLEEELRVCFANHTTADKGYIMRHHQAQVSRSYFYAHIKTLFLIMFVLTTLLSSYLTLNRKNHVTLKFSP